jgi:membrane protein
MQTIKHRLLSFGLIGSLGFLLLVSLAATAVVSGLGAKIKEMVPGIGVVVMYIINMVLTLGLTSVLFAIIFKVLPDAAIKWKHVWPGAIFTSILFVIGKFAISMYISKSDVGTTFGAAGSLVILLLWVYYSSIIIYFGAEFAMYYALNSGYKIEPENFAEWTDKPAIAGAEATSFKSKQQSPERTPKKERERSKEPHWSFATGTPQEQKEREKKSGPGVGSMLAGLALYMIKGGNKGG